MGNCMSRSMSGGRGGGRGGRTDAPGVVPPEHLYTKPSGLYPTCAWDTNMVRRLILRGELAPRFPGRDEAGVADEECPICMLAYPELNATKCCAGRICTECYLQIRPPRHNKEPCPFCKRKRVEAVLAPPVDHHVLTREEEDGGLSEQAINNNNDSGGGGGGGGVGLFRHAADSAPALSDASPSTYVSNCSTVATTVTTTAATAGTSSAKIIPEVVLANDEATENADSFITTNTTTTTTATTATATTTTTTTCATSATNHVDAATCSSADTADRAHQLVHPDAASLSESPPCPHARCPPHHAHLAQQQLDSSLAAPFYVVPPSSRLDPLLLEAMATELPPSVRSSDRASRSASASASASVSPASSCHRLDTAAFHRSSSHLSDQFNPCPSCLHCNHARTVFPSPHHFIP